MAFRFQKRVSLGKGAGLNVSKSGVSASYRTKHGSIGSRGFSLKTGIPGFTYRGSWSSGKGSGIAVLLIYIGIVGSVLIIRNVARLFIYGTTSVVRFIKSKHTIT